MCTLRGKAFEEVTLPKEGIVAYRFMRLTDDKFMFSGEKKKQARGREFASLFTHGLTKRTFTYYTVGVKYKAQNRATMFEDNRKAIATLKDEAGFYAFATYKEALAEKHFVWRADKNIVMVRVRLFGKAAKHFNGWRATHMMVETVVCGRKPKAWEDK